MNRAGIIECAVGVLLVVSGAARAATSAPGPWPPAFAVRTWDRPEGLPGDSVTALLQTSDGYLWVGTSAGLARFDGIRFTLVELQPARTNPPSAVTALCEDSAGALWVGTQREGLFRLDVTGPHRYGRAEGLAAAEVTSLAGDPEGRVWIGTRSGLYRWDGSGFSVFGQRDGLPDETVSGIHVARSGVVWVTTRAGMCQFREGRLVPYDFQTDSQGRSPEYLGAYEDRRGNLWAFGDTYLINLTEGKRFNYFRGADTASVRIWSLCEGRDGRLWIGTSGRGLFCFDRNRFLPVPLNELAGPTEVRAICEDSEGNLWLGAVGHGLVQLAPQAARLLGGEAGLPGGRAACVGTGPAGGLYVGFDNLGVFHGDGGRFERLGADGQAAWNGAMSVSVAADGTVWLGGWGNGLQAVRDGSRAELTMLHGLSDNIVSAVCVAGDGAIWAGTRAGLVHRITSTNIASFGPRQGLSGAAVTALLTGPSGSVWVGTADGAVLRHWNGQFVRIEGAAPKPGSPVRALHEEAGELWMGMDGDGLMCVAGRHVRHWRAGSGLPDDHVHGVLRDGSGDLWLACASGIFRVARQVVQEALDSGGPMRATLVYQIKGARGVAGPGWPRAVRASDGVLWFATADGVVTVEPRGLPQPPAKVAVYLEEVRVNERPLAAVGWRPGRRFEGRTEPMHRLPSDLRSVEFQFTAPCFGSPQSLRFRHRLEGLDSDWVEDGAERRVRYGRLPHGQYRFRVAARQADGGWSEGGPAFAFVVPTPLWKTPGALAAYAGVAAAGVTGVVRLVSHRRLRRRLERLEQQQALERERMRIARDMHDEIGSKLTRLSFLSERVQVESGQGGSVAEQVSLIAATSRELLQTLDEIVWAVNPRNDTLEHLASYLSQYATEYFQNTAVDCVMRLPRQVPAETVSAESRHNLFLSFEEALNNVLKHSGATEVRLEMTVKPDAFEVEIADNGRGFDPGALPATGSARRNGARGSGQGLANMRRRLAEVGGECRIESRPGAGTTVRLVLPLGRKDRGVP